jgi:hypothetical protein
MFVDVYISGSLPLEREDIEDALTSVLGDDGEIVGGGSGLSMVNVDIEVFESGQSGDALKRIALALRGLGLPGDTLLKTTDPDGQMTIAEVT